MLKWLGQRCHLPTQDRGPVGGLEERSIENRKTRSEKRRPPLEGGCRTDEGGIIEAFISEKKEQDFEMFCMKARRRRCKKLGIAPRVSVWGPRNEAA